MRIQLIQNLLNMYDIWGLIQIVNRWKGVMRYSNSNSYNNKYYNIMCKVNLRQINYSKFVDITKKNRIWILLWCLRMEKKVLSLI